MGGFVAVTHGTIGLLRLLEADVLQLLAPVGHFRCDELTTVKGCALLVDSLVNPIGWILTPHMLMSNFYHHDW